MSQEPVYFETPQDFRTWLHANHGKADEVWVGYRKRGTGLPSMTWPESVDEALCFGWIDGVRKSVDETSYKIRFTRRRAGSIWSRINLERVAALIEEGRMQPAGMRAFEARDPKRAGLYSFEQRQNPSFSPAQRALFRKNRKAWEFFESQPPGYRRLMTFWVTSAKRNTTQTKRLEKLIAESAAGRRIL